MPKKKNSILVFDKTNDIINYLDDKSETMINYINENSDSKYTLIRKFITHSDIPTINQEISKTLTASMHKMHRASQDNYFHDDINHKKYYNEKKSNLRKLTPNECRVLQGFPSDWNQVVSDTQAYRQF